MTRAYGKIRYHKEKLLCPYCGYNEVKTEGLNYNCDNCNSKFIINEKGWPEFKYKPKLNDLFIILSIILIPIFSLIFYFNIFELKLQQKFYISCIIGSIIYLNMIAKIIRYKSVSFKWVTVHIKVQPIYFYSYIILWILLPLFFLYQYINQHPTLF